MTECRYVASSPSLNHRSFRSNTAGVAVVPATAPHFLRQSTARLADMAAAVVADPEVDLPLWEGDGTDAEANINASVPGVKLRLGATHWLKEASGGADFALWSQLEMTILSACYFDADALDSVKVADTALSPATMAGITRAALNAGMDRSSKGSMQAALYHLAAFVRAKRSSAPVVYTIDDPQQFSDVDDTQPFSTVESSWLWKLSVPMCVDDDGDALGLAAMAEMLQGKFTSATRSQGDFKSCAIELYQITKETHSNLSSLSDERKAMSIASAIGSMAPDASLLVAVPVKKSLYAAMRYRRAADKALLQRFLQAWALAFPNLYELLTSRCSTREAWAYAARLLGQEPTFVALQALDARIPKLISAIEADATLASPNADVGARVAEMERLLGATAGARASSTATGPSDSRSSSEDTLNLTKLLAEPKVKALMAELEPLHVTPLVPYRVIRTMLQSDTALGFKFMQGQKVDNTLFKAFGSCVAPGPIVDAFKRHMAVDSDSTVRTELYELFDADAGRCTLPLKLVAGTFASDKGLHFNPWLEAAAPRFKVLMGGHTAHAEHDAAAAANPAVFFSNEYMLRHGATPLVEAFSFIGLPKEGSDSLANALATLLKYSFRVSLLPNSIEKGANGPIDLRQAKEASLRGLQRAGIRAMQC